MLQEEEVRRLEERLSAAEGDKEGMAERLTDSVSMVRGDCHDLCWHATANTSTSMNATQY